jgi:membrane-associated phospholipid phosphatase
MTSISTRTRRGRVALSASLVLALLAGERAPARAVADGDGPVPVGENFSPAERTTIVAVAVTGALALAVAPRLIQPAPSFGPPAPGSLDVRISNALYSADGTGARFLGGVPDVAGLYVIPYLPALFYAGELAVLERTGEPVRAAGFESRDYNPQHRLWAYVEALGWTALITGVTKVSVGRLRPYVVLDHPQLAAAPREDKLSFFSSHASGSFCAAGFVALDVSHTLRAGALRAASPARRLLLGIIVPYAAAFGVATVVGVSRIVDQQHWFTDVVAGAAVGTAAAHIAYFAHFDDLGRPRRRLGTTALAPPGSLGLAPMPGGVALTGLLP